MDVFLFIYIKLYYFHFRPGWWKLWPNSHHVLVRFLKKMALLARARNVFLRYPMIGNMLICGTMYGSGDLSQQTIRKCKKYDFRSAARVAAVGCVFFGPIYFKWYKLLDKLIKGKSTKHIVFKVILDQVAVAPPCICIFYIGNNRFI